MASTQATPKKISVKDSLANPQLRSAAPDEGALNSHAPKFTGEVLPHNASRKEFERVFSQYPPEIQAQILAEADKNQTALEQRFNQWRVIRAAIEEQSRKGEAKGDSTFEIIKYHWGKNVWGGENSYYHQTKTAKEEADKFLGGEGGEKAKNSPAQLVEHFLNSRQSLDDALLLSGAYDDPNGIVVKTIEKLGLNLKDVAGTDNPAQQIAQDQLKLIQHLRSENSHNSVELTSLAALSPLAQKKILELSVEERTKLETDAHNRITEIFRKNDAVWRHPSAEMIARGAVPMDDAMLNQKREEAIAIEKSMSLTRAAMGKVNAADKEWLKQKHPDLSPIWEEYNNACDPTSEWFNLSDSNKNFLTEELIVNGVLIAASGGLAGIGAAITRGGARFVAGKLMQEGAKLGTKTLLSGKAVLLGIEGTGFAFAHHGLTHAESLTNDESCLQQIMWSTITLGTLKGVNNLVAKGFTEKLAYQGIEGTGLKTATLNLAQRALKSEVAKFTYNTSAETLALSGVEGSKQYLNGGNFGDAFDAQQLAHAFLTAGSLKVGHVAAVNGPRWAIQVGKKIFVGTEVTAEVGGPMLPPPAKSAAELARNAADSALNYRVERAKRPAGEEVAPATETRTVDAARQDTVGAVAETTRSQGRATEQQVGASEATDIGNRSGGSLRTKPYQFLRQGWMREHPRLAVAGASALAALGFYTSPTVAAVVGIGYLVSGRAANAFRWVSNKTGRFQGVAEWIESKFSRPKTAEEIAVEKAINQAALEAKAAAKTLETEGGVTTKWYQANRAGWIKEHRTLAAAAGMLSAYGIVANPVIGGVAAACYFGRGLIASGLQKLAPEGSGLKRFADGFKSFVSRPTRDGAIFETALKEGNLELALERFADDVANSRLQPEQIQSRAKAAVNAAAKRINEANLAENTTTAEPDFIAIARLIGNNKITTLAQAQAILNILNGKLADAISNKTNIDPSYRINRIFRAARARMGLEGDVAVHRFEELRAEYDRLEAQSNRNAPTNDQASAAEPALPAAQEVPTATPTERQEVTLQARTQPAGDDFGSGISGID